MSDSEEELLLSSNTAKWYVGKYLRKRRQYSAHPINTKRYKFGEFHHLYNDIRKCAQKFFEYMRMTMETFDYILSKISNEINKTWCNCHARPILYEERLMITIRYLSTGQSFRSLAFSFRMGVATISKIVRETIKIIWKILQPLHMKVPTEQDFKNIANDYYNIWNFPNCLGSIDGKHVRVICPPHSGSMFYNYKQYFSIVLQGLVDANYKFISIDVGGYGKQSDGGTFRSSALFLYLSDGRLNIPNTTTLPNSEITAPYVFIGDEAYPLLMNLLKPYSRQQLDSDKEYFNARLSRARRTVECAFGIIYSKWRILSKAIETNIDVADDIVKAICILHNTIIDMEGVEHHLHLDNRETSNIPKQSNMRPDIGRPTLAAQNTRDLFKTYLCHNPITNNI